MPIQFPHCDPLIVHAPGSCEYCDQSGLQEVREAWGIAFTDQPDPSKTPCPGIVARGKNLQVWSGNRPKPTLESVADHLAKAEGEDGQVQTDQARAEALEEDH